MNEELIEAGFNREKKNMRGKNGIYMNSIVRQQGVRAKKQKPPSFMNDETGWTSMQEHQAVAFLAVNY